MVLGSELGELAKQPDFNLEQKLREYADHPNERVREHFKDIPPYIRHLIVRVFYGYTDGHNPGTHLRLVLNLLSRNVSVAFLDLNYDPYIEMALATFDGALAINDLDDYVAPGRQAILCKLHGSIDWGLPMGDPSKDRDRRLRAINLGDRGSMIFSRSRDNAAQFTHSIGKKITELYPVLTAPLAGKGAMDLVCPSAHLAALRAFLQDCHHFIMIGTSGRDEDVLALLRDSVKKVLYVDYVSDSEQNAKAVADRVTRACPAFGGVRIGLFPGGFRRYVGDGLTAFLARM
jgi:hypothetical protein